MYGLSLVRDLFLAAVPIRNCLQETIQDGADDCMDCIPLPTYICVPTTADDDAHRVCIWKMSTAQ